MVKVGSFKATTLVKLNAFRLASIIVSTMAIVPLVNTLELIASWVSIAFLNFAKPYADSIFVNQSQPKYLYLHS